MRSHARESLKHGGTAQKSRALVYPVCIEVKEKRTLARVAFETVRERAINAKPIVRLIAV